MKLKKLQNLLFQVFVLLMAICWITSLILEQFGRSLGNLPVIITGCTFTIYAFLNLAFEFYRIRTCTEEIPATVVSVKSSLQQNSFFRSYKAVYAYQWEGQHFESAAKTRYVTKTKDPELSPDSNCTVFINPNEPEIFCDKRALSYDDLILLIVGILLLVTTYSLTGNK